MEAGGAHGREGATRRAIACGVLLAWVCSGLLGACGDGDSLPLRAQARRPSARASQLPEPPENGDDSSATPPLGGSGPHRAASPADGEPGSPVRPRPWPSAELIVPPEPGALTPTAPDLLIAFIGDQGTSRASDAVLALIKSEGAHATLHNGDFDYTYSPQVWNDRIDSILGPDYPYFAVIGNHDAVAWTQSSDPDRKGYRHYIAERYARIQGPDLACTLGPLGLDSHCVFRGLLLLQSCVGVYEFDTSQQALTRHCAPAGPQLTFLRQSLASRTQLWALCAWHKNQADMQVGYKPDEVGWGAYRTCMNGGALIATAHEHSYSRTRILTDLGNRAAFHGATGPMDALTLAFGRTFVFVSGLGGNEVRPLNPELADWPWLAAAYTSDAWRKSGKWQSGPRAGGTHGATFILFNPGGDTHKAVGYFKDIDGRVADQFEILMDDSDPRIPGPVRAH